MAFPSPQQLLRTHRLSPKNSFGQNFLADPNLTAKIAALSVPEPGVVVLELGAGLGALTTQLLARGARVVAVERDRDLVPVLSEIFASEREQGRLRVLEADAKTLDWVEAARALGSGEGAQVAPTKWIVAGNLPYQLTGPLIEKSVQLARHLERAVFLVQKEVALRLTASPGTKDYGALSVFTQAQFRVQRAFTIGPGAFVPRPRVDSTVVVFEPLAEPVSEETSAFRSVVKAAFSARRKTLRNAWRLLLPKEQLMSLAADCAVDLDARGETLRVEDFARVARSLSARQGRAP